MNISFSKTGIQDKLNKMVQSSNKNEAFLNRDAYRIYQNYQTERWMSENGIDGLSSWKALAPGPYKRSKPTKYAPYPGQGRVLMVATGSLVASVVGPGWTMPFMSGSAQFHRKMVSGNSMTISTTLPYSVHANKERPFNQYGASFIRDIKSAYLKYVQGVS